MKHCPVCNAGHERRGIYCSVKCGRRAQNAKARGTTVRPPIRSFECKQCAMHCVPGHNVVAHAQQFCSYPCAKAWHNDHGTNRRTKQERAQAKLDKAAHGTSSTTTWYDRACPECGTRSLSRHVPRDDNGYCSRTCQRKQLHRRRRARERGTRCGTLSFRLVAERDGWVCRLCNKDVDPALLVPHPLAATLDHVLPLARGGEHTMSNAQLAHFLCNSTKRDTIAP